MQFKPVFTLAEQASQPQKKTFHTIKDESYKCSGIKQRGGTDKKIWSLCSPKLQNKLHLKSFFHYWNVHSAIWPVLKITYCARKLFTSFKYSRRPQLSRLSTFLLGLNGFTSSNKLQLPQCTGGQSLWIVVSLTLFWCFWVTIKQSRYFTSSLGCDSNSLKKVPCERTS